MSSARYCTELDHFRNCCCTTTEGVGMKNPFKRDSSKAWSTDKYFYKDTRGGISCATTIKPGKRTTPEAFGTYSTCEIQRRRWDTYGPKCTGHYSGPDANRNYCPDCGGPVIKWVDPERRRQEIAEEQRRKVLAEQ